MPGVSTFWFAALRPKSKAMYTGFLLAFITGVLDELFIIDKFHEKRNALVRCMNSTSPVGRIHPMQFEEGHKYCQKQSNGSHIHLPFVNHTNLDMFRRWLNGVPYWIQAVNVGPFLNSEDLTVHCLVLIDDYHWRKDNCTNKYASICVNATVRDIIWYSRQKSMVQNCDPTSCRTPVSSSAVTSEFKDQLYHMTHRAWPAEEEAKTSSIIIWVSTTFGSCLVVLIVIISGLCLKRKQGNNARTTFQQNELVQPSIVPQEVNDDNSVHVDVISDNIAGREATPYTSLQMTEKHLYTALVGPSFMSTEASSVIGRIAESDVVGPSFMSTEASYVIGRVADRDVNVETQFEMSERQENNYDESENDDLGDTNYDDVEVSDIPGQTNTESETTTSYVFVK
ncbi:uncharacterized protein LOC127861060 isoform X2 [Dreissena polymorpha]|uniref:uncharacterized protein LOC127861060 isoform X2 n=1 Tax=Dreissena polymorpha TaxID=45954 RepID=UPI00226456E5|nr:uncharacterized protein LOC127861060 isoform X2 [Dreissena polymorpha]